MLVPRKLNEGGNEDGEPMQRPTINWTTVNAGTILAIAMACVGGLYKFSSLEGRVDTLDQRGMMRITISDKAWADQTAFNKLLSQAPGDISALQEGQKGLNARFDRLADVLREGQSSITKDLGVLSTKVEVQSNKIENLTQALQAEKKETPR